MSMQVVVHNARATVRRGNSGDAAMLLSVRAPRFVVVERARRLVGCAELAPLSSEVAEVRSLVVDRGARGEGLAEKIACDCAGCTLFRSCEQQALVRPLQSEPRQELSRRTASAIARPHAY